jgi:hypothetical protein
VKSIRDAWAEPMARVAPSALDEVAARLPGVRKLPAAP